MGQPDRCQHAVHLINELIQTAQVTHMCYIWLELVAAGCLSSDVPMRLILDSSGFDPVKIVCVQERDGFSSALRGGRVRGRGDWTVGSPGPLQEVTYTISADKCGLVIGKGRRSIIIDEDGTVLSVTEQSLWT